jgi:hypothetical protein
VTWVADLAANTPFAKTTVGLVVIPAMAVLLAAIAVGGWRAVRGFIHRFDKIEQAILANATRLDHRMDLQDVKLENIEHETHVNSGSSLKDSVVRIEQKLESHLTDAAYQQGRLDRLAEGQIPQQTRRPRPQPR